MAEQLTGEAIPQFVAWFRSVAPYLHAFRGHTFVVAFGGEVAESGHFFEFAHDLNLLHSAGIRVVPLPGACAAIVALSASGLPSDRFAFEGFPPAKSAARRAWFEALASEPRTLIVYESPHRIVESLQDMVAVFGEAREAVYARELTKQFETVRHATLGEIAQWVAEDANQQRGEIVVLIHSATPAETETSEDAARILRILLKELPVSQAAALTAEITGLKKNQLYELALQFKPG